MGSAGRRTLVCILALGMGLDGRAQDPQEGVDSPPPVSFTKDLLPILRRSCQGCHQPAKKGGELDLTSYAGLLEGGDSEVAVVAGDPDQGLLLGELLPWQDQAPNMPKDAAPLPAAEVELFRRWIAEGAQDDTPDMVRDQVSPDHPPIYHAPPVLTSVAWSPDGTLLAVSGDHEVLLWSPQGTELVRRLVGRSERIQSLAFSPDGARLAVAAGSPGRQGELQVWEVAFGELLRSTTVTHDTLYGARWSPDGTLVSVGCSDTSSRVFDAATGAEVLFQGAHEDWVLDTVFSLDGSHLVTVSRDRSMKLISVPTQQFIDNITSITPGALKGGILSVDRHPVRDELVVGGADGTPKRYRMHREKKRVIGDDFNLLQSYEPLPGRVFCVRFDADGATLVAGSSHQGRGTVRAYATDGGATRWTFESPSPVYSVSVHGDGRVACAGFDGVVRLLRGEDGRLLSEFVPVPLATGAAQ